MICEICGLCFTTFSNLNQHQREQHKDNVDCCSAAAEKPGAHWIAFWFKNRYECEFYDSFGRRPEEYGDALRTFIDNHSTMCLYNNVQVQAYSSVTCGFHVLFYLCQRARNISLCDILNLLSEFPSDDFVRMFVLKNMIWMSVYLKTKWRMTCVNKYVKPCLYIYACPCIIIFVSNLAFWLFEMHEFHTSDGIP